MRKTLQRWAVLASLLTTPGAWAVTSDLQLMGLAVHQETGREIYLGAIHVDKLAAPPDNLLQFTGAKAMEYRVVARRTSIRSLLGSILLQAELASGRPADGSTATFVDAIMSRVQGSLYAGDALDIALNASGETVASLNGYELTRTSGNGVFDYLLLGWLGEKGASADFRTTLLAPEIDESLLAAYHAHEASAERVATISTWLAPVATATAPAGDITPATAATTTATTTTTTTTTAAAAETAVAVSDQPIPEPAVATTTALAVAEPVPDIVAASPTNIAGQAEAPLNASDTLQLAAITAQGSLLTPDPTLSQALSLADYSERLAEFNAMIMRKVYSRIRYPKSAVRRNLQGDLELDLHLNADGSLREALVARGSGHKTLDAAAIRAAENAFDGNGLDNVDEVAISEYGADNGRLIVPVPVSFKLME